MPHRGEAPEKRCSGGAAPSTVVEGFVVNHAVRWQSMPECSNFDLDSNKQAADSAHHRGDTAPGEKQGEQAATRPPRVSVTLSDYLAADFSQSPDDPGCDFGWFTPTASGGSIDELVLPSGDIREQYPAPSPGFPLTPLLFNTVTSAANTASLSPESFAGPSSRDAVAPSREGLDFFPDAEGFAAVASSDTGRPGPADAEQSGSSRAQQLPRPPQPRASPPLAPVFSSGSSGAGGSRSPGIGQLSVAFLPVARRANRMPEINQWHNLHRNVSSCGALAADSEGGGKCMMHLRRASFPISTRHFPDKPPTPTAKPGVGSGGSGFGSGVASAGVGSGSGLGGRALGRGSRKLNANRSPNIRHHDRAAHRPEGPMPLPVQQADVGGGLALIGGEVDQPQLRKVKPKSYAWALTEIRVVSGDSPWAPPRAEYLVVAGLGRGKLVAGWRRASDFERLARAARRAWMSKACVAWETLEHARRMDGGGPCNLPWVMRPRRLDSVYLQNKARFLEEFLKQFVFEANSKDALLAFLDLGRRSTMEIP